MSTQFQGTVDVTGEYKRVRDIIKANSKYSDFIIRSRKYKTADDLASEIFLSLFERGYWNKWDPKGLPLDKYTFMGVNSLVLNEIRRRDVNTKRYSTMFADTDDDAINRVTNVAPEDEALATVRVSHYDAPDLEATISLLHQSFDKYLCKFDTMIPGVTYSDVFALLELAPLKKDRCELLGIKSEATVSRLIRETKQLYSQFKELAA